MVKKIVALSVALVLMLASVFMGELDLSGLDKSPVKFGAGDGTSKVIETTQDLEELLSNIPDIEDYLENDSILNVNGNFKPFTMVETGTSKDLTAIPTYVEGSEKVRITETSRKHTLEICFTNTAVYYHAIGEMVNGEKIADQMYSTPDSGEATITTYDIEIYYSADLVLVKYNDYKIESAVSNSYGEWVVLNNNEVDQETAMALEMIGGCFGKWMNAETMSEEDFMASLAGLTETEMSMEYMVYQMCTMFSTEVVKGITTSTAGNTAYLKGLSTFITSNLDTMFDKNGNSKYVLKSSELADAAYLAAVGIPTTYINSYEADVGFNLNSDVVTVDQDFRINPSERRSMSVDIKTTFQNIENTVVTLDDVKFETVYAVLGNSIRKMMEEEMPGNGGTN